MSTTNGRKSTSTNRAQNESLKFKFDLSVLIKWIKLIWCISNMICFHRFFYLRPNWDKIVATQHSHFGSDFGLRQQHERNITLAFLLLWKTKTMQDIEGTQARWHMSVQNVKMAIFLYAKQSMCNLWRSSYIFRIKTTKNIQICERLFRWE